MEPVFTPAATLAEFLDRVARRTARVGIVGLGTWAAAVAAACRKTGSWSGVRHRRAQVQTLNAGGQLLFIALLPEHIAAAQAGGFRATADFAEAATLDAVLICVPTPLYPDHTPDMRA